jgi:glycosyltransferase involved in cell wall biosynthesis
MKLSVAIATLNEQNNIDRCFKPLKGWADEIVLVDGESSDKTVALAEKYGANVTVSANKPIFHINKQMAIDKCRGDWILQLDADEVVTKKLKKEIDKIISSDTKFNAFWIKRKNLFLGRWLKKSGQFPDPVIRLFKNGKARLPCKSVHEQIEVDGNVGWLENPMDHYSNPTFSEYLKRSNRYTSLTAQEMIEEKIKPGLGQFLKAVFMCKKTFFLIFFRHKGFVDGFPGFIFALFSGLHFITSYIKFWELHQQKRKLDIKKDWN